MTQEDKNLLVKDVSARLPYGVKVLYYKASYGASTLNERDVESFRKGFVNLLIPYLRPLSSMTEEEKKELNDVTIINCNEFEGCSTLFDETGFDWLNAHHFDYRGLIEKGLAIPVIKENNPYKSYK